MFQLIQTFCNNLAKGLTLPPNSWIVVIFELSELTHTQASDTKQSSFPSLKLGTLKQTDGQSDAKELQNGFYFLFGATVFNPDQQLDSV